MLDGTTKHLKNMLKEIASNKTTRATSWAWDFRTKKKYLEMPEVCIQMYKDLEQMI